MYTFCCDKQNKDKFIVFTDITVTLILLPF